MLTNLLFCRKLYQPEGSKIYEVSSLYFRHRSLFGEDRQWLTGRVNTLISKLKLFKQSKLSFTY